MSVPVTPGLLSPLRDIIEVSGQTRLFPIQNPNIFGGRCDLVDVCRVSGGEMESTTDGPKGRICFTTDNSDEKGLRLTGRADEGIRRAQNVSQDWQTRASAAHNVNLDYHSPCRERFKSSICFRGVFIECNHHRGATV